jgi:hypothetical protein
VRVAWILVVLALVTACGGGSGSGSRDSAALSDLTGVDQLREQFNEDRGDPRLILVLSPT